MKEVSWATDLKDAGEFQSHHIESTPSGQSYGLNGLNGHVPCNHVAVFEYTKATIRLSHNDGRMVVSREAR